MALSLPSTDTVRLATLAHALSDPTRLGVLAQLRQGERCVCELTADLGAAQSRLSFHLRVLKEAGLVGDRREGRWSFYRLLPEALDELTEGVNALRQDGGGLPIVGGCCD